MNRVVLIGLLSVFAMAQNNSPVLLQNALRHLPGVSLLDPADLMLPEGITFEMLKKDGLWSPWVAGDLDRDARTDAAATVVGRTQQGMQYGVLAVHANSPTMIHWVLPLDKLPIHGVAADKDGTLTPYRCVYCDANGWFNWTGKQYDFMQFGIGQVLAIGIDFGVAEGTELFARPQSDARIVGRVNQCTKAKVIAVRGTQYKTRWYFVEAILRQPVRGWAPADSTIRATCTAAR